MVRHGMVTIGVAVQAEAFTSESRATNTIESYTSKSNSNSNRTFSDNPSPQVVTSSSKSAIFLPPNRNGHSQTLKITFQYNKQNNLPEVVVNYNEEGQDTHLQLKALSPEHGRATVISKDYPDKNQAANAVQVYYFDRIDKPYSTQIFEVPPDYDLSQSQQETAGESSSTGVKAIEYYKSEGDTIDSLLPFKPKPKPITIESTDIIMTSYNNSKKSEDGQQEQYTAPPGIWSESADQKKSNKVEEESTSKIKSKSSSIEVVEKIEEIPKEDNKEESHSEKVIKSTGEPPSVAEEILGKKEQPTNPKKEKSNKNKLGGELRSRRKSTNSNNANNNEGSSPSPIRRSLSPVKDRSKIPVINSAVTGFKPCEYYRKKWLREMGLTGESASYGGNGYSTIHKTAGQKVVNKLTAQQKKLEEDAAAHRKRTEFIFFDEMILDSPSMISPLVPIRKKQTRLEPLHRTPPKCC